MADQKIHETTDFNKDFPKEDMKGTRILNCSPGSMYTCFEDVTYDELLETLDG